MPAVVESNARLHCVKCNHPITIEQVGTSVVVQSALNGWRKFVVVHLQHLVATPLTEPDATVENS